MNSWFLHQANNKETNSYRISRLFTKIFILLVLTLLIKSQTLAQECSSICAQTIEYQHPTSILQFANRQQDLVNLSGTAVERVDQSRHRFDIVLTQNGSERIIFDHHGNQHKFLKDLSGSYISSTESGSLRIENGISNWIDIEGNHHQFHGSYLTKFTQADGQALSLRYQQNRLHSVTDELGNTLTLGYDGGGLSQITTPSGEVLETSSFNCASQDSSDSCDTQSYPVPGFTTAPTRAGTIRIDARPSTCESYFVQYFGTERGYEIELGLAGISPYNSMISTVRSFPIVDFIDTDRLLVVRSRDLANPSFNDAANPNALLYRLMRDGQEIQTRFLSPLNENGLITTTEDGRTTTIELGNEPPNITLQLVIRHQIASPTHWSQISQARAQLLAKYGIVLEVVIIP